MNNGEPRAVSKLHGVFSIFLFHFGRKYDYQSIILKQTAENPAAYGSRVKHQDGKILVIRMSRGRSMLNMQIIQGYTVFLDRNIMARQPPVTPMGP